MVQLPKSSVDLRQPLRQLLQVSQHQLLQLIRAKPLRGSLARNSGILTLRRLLLLQLLFPVLLKAVHLLLELHHLLLIKLRLLAYIAENKADITGDGAQAEQLAAAIELAFGANRAGALG